ncbi:carbohydrate kinase [Mangrovactinospora gilvigrisea]|uniref:Carbohydrate kinase n=1 Tax=Mangrovactinospora gilvigrisea TaxID=1428644 RepID=A0A1J7C3P3_9ACTN|nr:FGGY family carbohydrate kinase [Mangrovactinospora gilvigrisea]OIV36180.1 carbohydrate kinase [Mangrovactinospora gilvigrisea]
MRPTTTPSEPDRTADGSASPPAPSSGVVVGIDVATANVRVLCVDPADGRVAATGGAPLPPPERGPGGRAEQDARAWWPAVAAALRKATSQLPRGGREVLGLAVSATSGTIVLADGAGEPLGPALMYDDRRAADRNALAQQAAAPRWAELGISVGPTAALGRIAELAAATPSGAPGARRLLHTPDLLGLHLTGHPVPVDWSHTLKSGYDPLRGEWAAEALDALGIPAHWLPEVLPPASLAGRVCAGAAAETGLPAGAPVRLGMTDGCCGQLATGAVSPGQFVGILGTTYVLKGVTEQLVKDPSGALYSHRHPDGWWLPGGASNTGGEALADTPAEKLAALDEAAARLGPAPFAAYPLRREGERFPFVSGAARGFSLGRGDDEAVRHRAALEGVAFLERLALERVRALGVTVEAPLSTAGGGSRSGLWNRIRATALGIPLRVVDRAETAAGAALLAAVGGPHPDLASAAAAMVGPGRLVHPDPAERDALDASYAALTAALRERGWLS